MRLCFAKNFAQFAEAFGKEITDNNLIQTFNLLLNDNEPEVKNAAIYSLSQSLKNLSTEKICNILLPTLATTYADSQVQFKAGVAIALCEMAEIVGKDYCHSRVMPILLELLKDESSEVRLNASQNMIKLAPVVGAELLQQNLLMTLKNLTNDPQWRVRMAVFELVGDLSIKLGLDVYRREGKDLQSIFMLYLSNPAWAVREMGSKKASQMAKVFGGKWAHSEFCPLVIGVYKEVNQTTNFKIAALKSLVQVMPYLSEEQAVDNIYPIVINALQDGEKINLRSFTCGLIRKQKADFLALGNSFNEKLRPVLEDIANTPASYFDATLALQETGEPQADEE